MIRIIFILSVTIIFGFSENEKWEPVLVPEKKEGLINSAREIEVFQHGIKKEWGYNKPQTDTFIVIHPDSPKKNAPLYVVLHSAGHDVFSAVKCTNQVGNHDIYHSPPSPWPPQSMHRSQIFDHQTHSHHNETGLPS